MKTKLFCTLSKLNTRVWPLALLCLLAPTIVLRAQAPPPPSSCPSCTIDVTPTGPLATGTVSTSHTAPGWSVQYLVDADSAPPSYSYPQTDMPRDNRGLGLSPTGQFLYAGYNNGNPDGSYGEVHKIDTTNTDPLAQTAVVAFLIGYRGKAIAVDDKGRVYLAEGSHEDNNPVGLPDPANRLVIYDSNLNTQLFNFPIAACPVSPTYPGATANDNCLPPNARPEGVAVVRQGTDLVLYVSDRSARKTLDKFILTEGCTPSGSSSPGICSATFAGEFSVPGAVSLRGVDVDPFGRIWIADANANEVFVITWNGSASTSTPVGPINRALDVALDSAHAFVTTDDQTFQIQVIDQTTLTLGLPLTPPYAVLDPPINPGGDGLGHLSGIVVACPIFGCSTPGFYVANEAGETAVANAGSGSFDREPIIRANAGTVTPCPSCGKVTGGGQIAVPGGSANFGFNAQVKKGVVNGVLEYLEHSNGDNWHSISMTSLVVSSDLTNTTFTGTIKEKGDPITYNFCVYVEDNKEPGKGVDKFEFKHAPQPSVPQCATKATAASVPTIARGNIQIHKKPVCD